MNNFVSVSKKLPFQTGAVLCLLVFAMWYFLDSQRDTSIQSLAHIRTAELTSQIKADIRSRIPALQRIARRWEHQGGTPKAEFLQDTNTYIKDLPGLQALEWVDKNFYVRWIAPLKGNEKALNLNLGFEKSRRIALENARDKRVPTMTSPIDLVQGGKGFLIYVPIFINDKFEGFILAVYKIEEWLDYVFSNMVTKINHQFEVNIAIDNKQVYSENHDEMKFYSLESKSIIDIIDHTITVQLIPTDVFLNEKMTYTPEVVAVSGIFLSILIAIMVFLLQKTKLANLSANEANNAKSKFLSSMSHELRTPLNAILGFSQLMELDEEDESKKENIVEVIDAGKHLLRLINEILDLSKIESGHIELIIKSHNLNKIIKNSIAMVKPLADKHSIHIDNKISSSADINILVDEMRFKQVLLNILSNAVKYNNENGKVIIDYSSTNKKILTLSISDTGMGLSLEQQANLFKPFERFGAENSHIEGTGLGLVISKELIELMGGQMGVESETGKGSRFWFSVPTA